MPEKDTREEKDPIEEKDSEYWINIPADKVNRIKNVCGQRKEGRYSVGHIVDDLKEFIETDLRRKLIGEDIKGDYDVFAWDKRKKDYESYAYLANTINPTLLTRAFNKTGVRRHANPFLERLLELYLEAYETEAPPNSYTVARIAIIPCFSLATMLELSHRASGLCSKPECRRPTSAPSDTNPDKAIYLGVACPIYGIQENDPRYDPTALVRPEPDDIRNGIWLCADDAQMVNEKQREYPATLLKEWKSDHEALMRAVFEGKKRVFIALLQDDDEQAPTATAILDFFNTLHLLYAPSSSLSRESIIGIVKNIGTYLLEQNARIDYGTRLQQQVYAIDAACDAFLELTADSDAVRTGHTLEVLKKVIGMNLYEMATIYQVSIPSNILNIIPST
jgi:hypothetical protein